jgi:menaquinone-specific isochorismate synthase
VSSASVPEPVVVRTVAIPDLEDLVAHLPNEAPLAWIRQGEGLVGWGVAASVTLSGSQRFARASAWWRKVCADIVVDDEVRVRGTGPVAFGSFAFDPRRGSSVLIVPRVLLGRRNDRSWITTFGDVPVPRTVVPVVAPSEVTYAEGSLSAVGWEDAVATAVKRIAHGELEKVVLARDLIAAAAAPIDARWLLSRLADGYPGCWSFAVDGLIGATPEMLVRLDNSLVTSRVLAGTIRRTGDDAHDLALAASLARSSKDLDEHEYAVRSVADALARHCTGMSVPESPFVLHLPNVMHLATDVAGVLADGSTSLELAAALHPTAAVCGTPRDAALRVIRDVEGMDRDRYAGPVGWMDADGDGDWGIALRCARIDPDDGSRARLFAGCGIVAGSDPEAELAESQAKFVPMRDALSDS